MRSILCSLVLLASAVTAVPRHETPIAPKVMIISMFEPEGRVWLDRFSSSGLGNITAQTVPVAGLSMLFPSVYCTHNKDICQLTVGEGEINAAASIMAFILSPKFDLRNSYFLLGGIGGVNPHHATLGSVAFSRYAVQVALQYEIDSRSIPDGWATGYIPYGRKQPFEYPTMSYGTEVFELNEKLRDVAHDFASRAKLDDSKGPIEYRSKYVVPGNVYKQATNPPSVIKCDTATSDVYYSGQRLAESFESTMKVWTNGTGKLCMTAQEDNAVLEGLLRGGIEGLVDFARVILLRAGSDFDRPPPGQTDYDHLISEDQNGFEISVNNTYLAGIEVVRGIVSGWNCNFRKGVKPTNYIGDIFGSLGGHPDFGLGSITDGKSVESKGQPSQRSRSFSLGTREMGRRRQLSTHRMGKM